MTINEALNILQFDCNQNLKGEELKKAIQKAYRTVSKKFHPDVNPAGEYMMKLINNAYEHLNNQFKYISLDKVVNDEQNFSEEISEALNNIINYSQINIEVCGNWVWVSGNTKSVKDVLKKEGFKWASKKFMWYFRPVSYKKRRNKKTLSMEEIREKYGSEKVKSKARLLE